MSLENSSIDCSPVTSLPLIKKLGVELTFN